MTPPASGAVIPHLAVCSDHGSEDPKTGFGDTTVKSASKPLEGKKVSETEAELLPLLLLLPILAQSVPAQEGGRIKVTDSNLPLDEVMEKSCPLREVRECWNKEGEGYMRIMPRRSYDGSLSRGYIEKACGCHIQSHSHKFRTKRRRRVQARVVVCQEFVQQRERERGKHWLHDLLLFPLPL